MERSRMLTVLALEDFQRDVTGDTKTDELNPYATKAPFTYVFRGIMICHRCICEIHIRS